MKNYEQVYNIVCEMLCDAKDLEVSSLSPGMPLLRLKLDSLDYVELMVLAKREFGVTLTGERFINKPDMTLGELCHLLAEEQA